MIGGIAATTQLEVTTAVTCPTIRIHPAIVAQPAATAASMLPGRFRFGVGSGENLNEHILGDRWPPTHVRLDMLEEAVEIIRTLWRGEVTSHEGKYYRVENARLYSLPAEPPPVLVSGLGPKAVQLAALIGDGYVSTIADADLVHLFVEAGGRAKGGRHQGVLGRGRDRRSQDGFRAVADRRRPWRALPGTAHAWPFRAGHPARHRRPGGGSDSLRPGPERHAEALRRYFAAGFDEVYVSQIGKDQPGFLDFYRREVVPRLG